MRNPLFLLCLVLLGCSSFQGSVSNHRDIASLKNQATFDISLKLSQDIIFANGANTVTLKVESKNPEIKAEDLKKAIDEAIFQYYKKLPLEKKGQVLGFYKERAARGFTGV